jgi:diguanylate cyclase (GGDEF)-like protein
MHHKNKVLLLISLLLITLVSNLSVGETKTWHEIDWLDVIGEGGSAFAIGLWVLFILGSRPLGRVTDLLCLGLGFMLLAFWQDALDEFIRIPAEQWWHQGFESIAMPMGIMLLTYGLYHWHQEQIAINDQLRNREQYFREHLSMDKLTNLGRIDFLRCQIDRFIKVCPQETHSLLILDVENFSDMNRTYGIQEGDCYLHALSEILILNLRKQDLLCRYAGDRFAIVLPNTDDSTACEISTELASAVDHFAFKSQKNNKTLYQKVNIGIASGKGLPANRLIYLANESLKRKKPIKFVA